MTKTITGEEPFQILAHSFAVGPSNEGFTLQYSADGEHFTSNADSTPANTNLMVNGVPKGMYFRLLGNASTCTITY